MQSNSLTTKEITLSVLYFVILLPFAVLINFGIAWMMDNVWFNLFNWFNGKSLFIKILLMVFAGGLTLGIVWNISQIIGNALSFAIFGSLPRNLFTKISSAIIYWGSIVFGIYALWQVMPSFGFWTSLEFLFLCLFIMSINSILNPKIRFKDLKEY